MKLLILVLSISLSLVSAEYTKFSYTVRSSPQAKVYNIDLVPVPIIQPGTGYLTIKVDLLRDLNGPLKTKLDIVRSVNGIKLPIRCLIAQGVYVGSCTYDDICVILQTLLPDFRPGPTCPADLASFGIDCSCPIKSKKQTIDLNQIQLNYPDAANTIFSFLASGDFDIKIDLQDLSGPIAAVDVGFTVKPAGNGK